MRRDTLSLEDWKDSISSFKKLNINEAQNIYRIAVSRSKAKYKKLYMDKLILGTLYIVYDHIERNGLELFSSEIYDINDIINSFTEVWIQKIYKGELLKVKNFSTLFRVSFFNEVYRKLGGESTITAELLDVSTEDFIDMFMKFLELKNSRMEFLFRDVVEDYFNKKFYPYNYHSMRESKIIKIFERIYENLGFDELDDIDITPTKIRNWTKLLISAGIQEPTLNSQDKNVKETTESMEDQVLQDIFLETFIDDVDANLSLRERKVIHLRFGLDDGMPHYLKEVAKNFNVKRERIRQIETKALKKLRNRNKIKKYNEN